MALLKIGDLPYSSAIRLRAYAHMSCKDVQAKALKICCSSPTKGKTGQIGLRQWTRLGYAISRTLRPCSLRSEASFAHARAEWMISMVAAIKSGTSQKKRTKGG